MMTDKQKIETTDTSRRKFFKLASVGAAGAAATALAGGASEVQADDGAAKQGGYQLTEHVKKAYDASRF